MINGGLRTRGITKKSTDEKPLITVVTVVYNGEATLEQTIQSVVNQSYVNVEYIIVDGASTDSTLDIIKKYEDKIDYWQSEPDKGIYDAMNKGIGLASGEWINFMNAGDFFFENEVISKIVGYCEHNTKLYGDYYNLTEKKMISQANLQNLFLRNINHQTIFYCSKYLKNTSFNLKYKILADWELNLRLFAKNKFDYFPITIANYEGAGISTTKTDMSFYKDYNSIIFYNYGFLSFIIFISQRLLRKIKFLKGNLFLQK